MQVENEALNAYLSFLRTKGITQKSLDARIEFLARLIAGLASKPYDRNAYAGALNTIMKKRVIRLGIFTCKSRESFIRFGCRILKPSHC